MILNEKRLSVQRGEQGESMQRCFDLMQKLMDGGVMLFSKKAGTLAAGGAVLTASRPDQLGDNESTKKWEESQA